MKMPIPTTQPNLFISCTVKKAGITSPVEWMSSVTCNRSDFCKRYV